MPAAQYRYWMLTIPYHLFTPFLHPEISWIKGQLEKGNEDGYLHWQLLVHCKKKSTLKAVKDVYGDGVHCEATRSEHADSYVHKDETHVEGTRFELGRRPFKRNSITDWKSIAAESMKGNLKYIFEEYPDLAVRHYHSLRSIYKDHAKPNLRPKDKMFCRVYYGDSGTGKSWRAYTEATANNESVYFKNPSTKWWDGYNGEANVIIDEFTGKISIENLLRWLDFYPCLVEVKGSQVPICAIRFWITSNLPPSLWYPEATEEQMRALRRRLAVVMHFSAEFGSLVVNNFHQ